MASDAYERIEEAINQLNITLDKTEDSELVEDIEATLELLEEAQHGLEVAEEMNEMMMEHEDNLEDLTEL